MAPVPALIVLVPATETVPAVWLIALFVDVTERLPRSVTLALMATPVLPSKVILVPFKAPGNVRLPPKARRVSEAVPVSMAPAGMLNVVPAIALTAWLVPLTSDVIVKAFTSRMLTAPPANDTEPTKSLLMFASVISPVPALIALVPVTVNAPSCVIAPLLLVATRLPPTVP